MKLTVQRTKLCPTSLLGELYIEGQTLPFCHTLEPRPDRPEYPCIPAGTYPLTYEPTHNVNLWSPDGRLLPRIQSVPGRTGIVIHAGNTSKDTKGCLIVAHTAGEDSVSLSRAALIDLTALLRVAQGSHQIIMRDIEPPSPDPFDQPVNTRV